MKSSSLILTAIEGTGLVVAMVPLAGFAAAWPDLVVVGMILLGGLTHTLANVMREPAQENRIKTAIGTVLIWGGLAVAVMGDRAGQWSGHAWSAVMIYMTAGWLLGSRKEQVGSARGEP